MKFKLMTAAVTGVGLLFALACGGGSTVDTFSFAAPSTSGGTTTCPAGAFTGQSFADGTRVKLVALHVDDAYAGSFLESSLPLTGTATPDLTNTEGCWMGGPWKDDNGDDYYFYKAAFVQL